MPIILSVTLIFGLWLGNRIGKNTNRTFLNLYPSSNKINMLLDYIEEKYVDPVSKKELIELSIPQILNNLDPHSVYIPSKEVETMNEPLEGNFYGIGIQFNIQNDTIVVINTISGGPSALLGVLPGDRIVSINDTLYVGSKITSDQVMKKLRGKEGTKVRIGIKRKETREVIYFEISRGKIPLYSIDVSYMIDNEIGYIKISKFSRTTYNEFITSVRKLINHGMKKIIIDLRGNNGGYLDAATNIADQFLDGEELIVFTKGKSQPTYSTYSTPGGICGKMKVIILIDEWSASASEILAGAIQDNDRGLIIGRRSFGKGLVQEQTQFPDSSAIRLTIARYYTPTGRCIQRPYQKGVEEYYNDIGE
ncbi:MAG: S41 family peptidase, partial [Bacteroidia bacterium]|nr:S41 family peptidase [Bacteroidia bacterium]